MRPRCDATPTSRVGAEGVTTADICAANRSDLSCLDALEDVARFDHIGTVVIVSGDSDYMPAAQKIKAAGRRVIGLGARKTTNSHWATSCHGFHYYEDLVSTP